MFRTTLVATTTLLVFLLSAGEPLAGQALNPPYLSGMPAVDRVERDVHGRDALDTAARRAASFWQLRKVIEDVALSQRRADRQHTPDEQRLANAYYAAYYKTTQSVEQARSPADRRTWMRLESTYRNDQKFLADLLTRVASPAVRAAYAEANATFAARHQQSVSERKAEERLIAANKSGAQAANEPKEDERKVARCLAAGRSQLRCTGDMLAQGMEDLVGMFDPASKKTLAPGLRLAGAHNGAGGFRILSFGPTQAVLRCKGAGDFYGYSVERKGNQVFVHILKDDEKQAVLELRPDGRLDGTGQSITVIQSYSVDLGKTVERNVGGGTTTTQHKGVGAISATCNIGVLGPATEVELGILGDIADELGADAKARGLKAFPGIRMGGAFKLPGGLSVEFHPEAAVLECGDAIVGQPYTVERKGNQFLITVRNGATPLPLELKPDGTLAGSGQVEVSGQAIVGFRPNRETGGRAAVLEPRTNTCRIGGAIPHATGPAQPAVLSVVSGFAAQPGAVNPLAGRNPVLLKDSFENVLRKAGFEKPARRVCPGIVACDLGPGVSHRVASLQARRLRDGALPVGHSQDGWQWQGGVPERTCRRLLHRRTDCS